MRRLLMFMLFCYRVSKGCYTAYLMQCTL
ncbi:hypothetical protein ZEAMMB73_Zm00001d015285 [Zea mays]|uniref:Uncharacterized protein n=1 Tax=Zea mays TaxID=4577 RepID=A0A1D6H110_MAIZE|nr:hypothetical protein ZEAMMB73_Zm00001d015285 [Zea mays]